MKNPGYLVFSREKMTFTPPLLCLFSVQLRFLGRILTECPVMILYVPVLGKKETKKTIFLHKNAVWRCRKQPSSRRFCSISLKKYQSRALIIPVRFSFQSIVRVKSNFSVCATKKDYEQVQQLT